MLKSLRVMYDLTQEDMARKLCLSIVSYRNKENGQNDFSLKEAKIISNLFNKTIDEIFFANEVYENGTKEA
jgi:DNA-binding XRE family transcriptional regulator